MQPCGHDPIGARVEVAAAVVSVRLGVGRVAVVWVRAVAGVIEFCRVEITVGEELTVMGVLESVGKTMVRDALGSLVGIGSSDIGIVGDERGMIDERKTGKLQTQSRIKPMNAARMGLTSLPQNRIGGILALISSFLSHQVH